MHADRGSEYTAGAFRAACQRLGACQSMGRPGSALDNAVIESWHSTLEFELRSVEQFATKAAARAMVPAWIHEYNHIRRHSACQMMSPVDYERALAAGGGSLRCPCFSATQSAPVLSPVQVVPLYRAEHRGLHGSYHEARTGTISQIKVSTL